MKFLIVFIALFGIAVAAPPVAEVLRSDSQVGPESFSYAFETSDGVKAESEGQLLNIGSDHESLSVTGSFSYIGDDGVTYLVNYVAGENGFQPTGAHLPVVPPA